MKKDWNYIASVEKAIAEKYGKISSQDFRSDWEPSKEDAYLEQLQDARRQKEKKDSNEIDKIIMNEFKKIINEKLTSERFEIEKKKYFFDTIYKKDGVLNPAQIYGEALTVGLTFDDINKWQERLNNISLNDV